MRRGERAKAPGLGTVGVRDGTWARGRRDRKRGGKRTDVGRAGVGQMVHPCRVSVWHRGCVEIAWQRVCESSVTPAARVGQTCAVRAPAPFHPEV